MTRAADLASPNEKNRRQDIAQRTRAANIELAKKAQIESQVAARKKAEKRREMTEKRAAKRSREETDDSEEPDAKKSKKKSEGRVIDYTERDHKHVTNLFHTNISYFGNTNILGLFCGYDCMPCPTLVYPIFTGPQTEKKQSVYSRKFILGVGKASNVITGIRQAFTELYPHLPADRVYDWKLMKWNKKAYKAATITVAVDPGVLSSKLFSSKSFGGASNLQLVKITDDLTSARKMECAIDVSRYINEFVPEDIKKNFPGFTTLGFEDVRSTLKAVEMSQTANKETEKEVGKIVESSDIIQEMFDRSENKNAGNDSDSESDEESSE